MRVLVVEDSDTMGRVICELLKRIGFHNTDLAHGGATAIAKMRKASYGLVISDWNMEPMSGLDLLKQVRSDAAFAGTRFLMMSAQSSMENVLAAKNAGVDNFIVKPFNAVVLKEKIDSIFASVDAG
jgi:two-component system, chemotaxis family, chemotaxis protein CheY